MMATIVVLPGLELSRLVHYGALIYRWPRGGLTCSLNMGFHENKPAWPAINTHGLRDETEQRRLVHWVHINRMMATIVVLPGLELSRLVHYGALIYRWPRGGLTCSLKMGFPKNEPDGQQKHT
jgi:hypothetical protein